MYPSRASAQRVAFRKIERGVKSCSRIRLEDSQCSCCGSWEVGNQLACDPAVMVRLMKCDSVPRAGSSSCDAREYAAVLFTPAWGLPMLAFVAEAMMASSGMFTTSSKPS